MMTPASLAKYITGKDGVVLELMTRGMEQKKITQSWFRRCCRRNGVSSTEMKVWLYKEMITWSRSFPLELINKPVFKTYYGWYTEGYHVIKGQTAGWRNSKGEPVFHRFQVQELV